MDSPQEEALFGRWLRKRRKALDLMQKMLARRVGCSPSTVRKLEADVRHPSRHVAWALAEVLGVPEAERNAFIAFARGGWADRLPGTPLPDLERPWLDRGPGAGVEPAAEASLDVAAAPPKRPADARSHDYVPDAPRVVTRGSELAWLEHELEQALAGNGRTALVAGEAGLGKTALMTAFAARAQAMHPELLVAMGTCNAYTGRGDPFLPFREVLAQLTGDGPEGRHLDAFQRERAARLTRAAPLGARALIQRGPHLLGSLVPLQALEGRLLRAGVDRSSLAAAGRPGLGFTAVRRSTDEEQQALRAEAAAALTALADDAPLLLLLDDLQWLGDSSAELLLHLAAVAAGHRLLLLGAYRPGDLAAASEGRQLSHPLVELARRHARTLDLTESDGRAFVDAWLDRQANALDSDFRASLWRQTGGQPLFTIELLRALHERGDLVRDADGRWLAAPDLRWDRVPARIADAIAARVETLDRSTKDVLRVASVEGDTFTSEVVARVLRLNARQVARTLGTDLDRAHRLVAAVDVQRGPADLVTRYRFRHSLIQRYVYDSIEPGERAYLHEHVAAALEGLLGEDADPVALALHYTHAHAPQRAAVHHCRAGDLARQAHALDQATQHYQVALEHWPDPDPVSRAELLRDLAACQEGELRYEDARRSLTEAIVAFEAAGDPHSAADALISVARTYLITSVRDYAGVFESARRAVAMLEPLGESAELAAALAYQSHGHTWVAEYAEGAAFGERAMAMAERVGGRDVLAVATGHLGMAVPYLDPVRVEEGVALLERSFRLCDELGLALEAGLAVFRLADVLEGLGHHQDARARYLQALEYARRNRVALHEHQAQHRLWWNSWTHGDWRDAYERAPHIRAIADGTVLEFQMPRTLIGLASCELDLGRARQARACWTGRRPQWISWAVVSSGSPALPSSCGLLPRSTTIARPSERPPRSPTP